MTPSTRDPDELRSQIRGSLAYSQEKDSPCIDVLYSLYSLNEQDLREYEPDDDQVELPHEGVEAVSIMRLNPKIDQVALFPLKRTGQDCFRTRYQRVEVIALDGFGISNRSIDDDVVELLATLPKGFTQNPDYGLGLRKDYRHIVQAIEEIPEVKMIVISKEEETSLLNDIFYLSFRDFEAARRGINSCHRNALQEAVVDKTYLVHNMLLTRINAAKYPPRVRVPSDGEMAKILELAAKKGLSERNQLAAAKLVTSTNRSLVKRHPEALMELRRDIELVTLEEVIAKITFLIGEDTKEAKWQKLFNDHPFILSLAFSVPIILFQQQASVGGQSFIRTGEKIVDFLFTNGLTDNVTIVEIKAASTPLVSSAYRNVYPPSKELAGSIAQALDQKHKLEENFLVLRNNSDDRVAERYSIKCIVVAGKVPLEKERLHSFELFRVTLHDVVVVTFDELLAKLQHLHQFLSSKKDAPIFTTPPPADSLMQPVSDEDIPF